jgi:superfamily II DNA or RNA helicase
MIALRPPQQVMYSQVKDALRSHTSVLLQSATGTGKTAIGATMCANAHGKGHTVIWLTHRKELLDQTSKTFMRVHLPHTFIASGKHFNPRMRACIATVGTLGKRLTDIPAPKLLIVDECHHANAVSFGRIIDWAKRGGAIIIGLTATPWRLSGEGLKDYFDHMVRGPEVSWLIEQGYLSEYRAFIPSAPDMSHIHTVAGDYARDEIEQVMSGKAILRDCVSHYQAKAAGKRAVLFAVSVKHSETIVADFNSAGISAAHIDATTPDGQRRQRIMDFAGGKILVLSNVDLVSEGFDLSAIAGRDVPIEAAIQMRPTQSLSLHLQQIGRALRPKPEPSVLLDLCGNLIRHGLPDTPHDWSLEPREKKRRGEKSAEPTVQVKQCPNCFFAHTPGPAVCPNCGHEYAPTGRQLDEVAGDLQEVSKEQIAQLRKKEQASARKLEDLIALAERRGYKNPEKWASHIFTARLQKKSGAAPVLPGTYDWR